MKTIRFRFWLTIGFFTIIQLHAQEKQSAMEDGVILRQEVFSFAPFDSIAAKFPYIPPKQIKSVLAAADSLKYYRIQYASGGLKIWGFLFVPAMEKGKKYPVLIWNHGGAGERSKIGMQNFTNFYELQFYASKGFVVLASQYRGIDGSEGKDEAGGTDLEDVLNLIKTSKRLPYADTSNVFMSGISRGGMMTLMAARFHSGIKAISIAGTPTNYERGLQEKPTLLHFARDNWPDFDKNMDKHVKRRSAVLWVEELEAPVLIMHGSADPAVSPRDALDLAVKMEVANKLYQLIIYPLDGHTIEQNLDDRLTRSLEWFTNPHKYPVRLLMRKLIQNKGLDTALAVYKRIKGSNFHHYDNSEQELRSLGNEYLNIIQQPQTAVILFELNAEAYPYSARVYEDLGKAYEKLKLQEKAVAAYKKSLTIDPANLSVKAALERININK